MRRTMVILTEEQYFYLREKALELQRRGQWRASLASVIRDLIEEARHREREEGDGRRG